MRTLCAIAVVIGTTALTAQEQPNEMVEWRYVGADQAASKYSPVADINITNVSQLEVAWTWNPDELPNQEFGTRPGSFEATALMIDNVIYVATMYTRVVALDAETGEELWAFDPEAYRTGPRGAGPGGFKHRGAAVWGTGDDMRVFINSRDRIYVVDAQTGEPIRSFGDDGHIVITEDFPNPVTSDEFDQTSPAVIFDDLIIIGSRVPDRVQHRFDTPGSVQAFDAVTGIRRWVFYTVPQSNDAFGADTWENGSNLYTGNANVWSTLSGDDELGHVYLATTAPTNDYWGGERKGDNLFSQSIVALDVETGERLWHYQFIHHTLWNYDPPAAPVLLDVVVDGRPRKIVVQLTKQAFAYVLDRVTGEPIWPIEERPAPQSGVAGEASWPTQPYPTKPAAFDQQGLTIDDLIDFTPELRQQAIEIISRYDYGPLYTPPSIEGSLVRPGGGGAVNWGGGAFDAGTGFLYVKTSNMPAVMTLERFDPTNTRNPFADATEPDYVGYDTASGGQAMFEGGLPLNKPPYGFLVAIDMHEGDIAWRVPFGRGSERIRRHPALDGVDVPERLGTPGAPGAIVTRGGLVFAGGGENALYAFDKATGDELWAGPLNERSTATPMTYQTSDGRQFVVIATGSGGNQELVAFAISE